jgi:excisionase family DNA binding protein
MKEDVISPHIAAVYLGLSEASIYRMIRAGTIPVIRDGRAYRIPYEGLKPLIEKHGGEEAARGRLWDRFLRIADRNPDVDGDALLDELEREDAERKAGAAKR